MCCGYQCLQRTHWIVHYDASPYVFIISYKRTLFFFFMRNEVGSLGESVVDYVSVLRSARTLVFRFSRKVIEEKKKHPSTAARFILLCTFFFPWKNYACAVQNTAVIRMPHRYSEVGTLWKGNVCRGNNIGIHNWITNRGILHKRVLVAYEIDENKWLKNKNKKYGVIKDCIRYASDPANARW